MIGRLLLLAALMALGAVLVEWRLLDRDAASPVAETGRPGLYLTGVALEEFGRDGRLRLALQAAAATEAPETGQVNLREVVVDYRAPGSQGWRLTSAEAHIPRGSQVVEFEGDVRMTGRPGGEHASAELGTERLTLDTAREHAETRAAVTLAFGPHLIHARGMQADLKGGSLQLEAEVNGLFTP